MKLLYGTGNLAKLSAMRNRLEQLDIELIGLNDLRVEGKNVPEVKEDGNTPLENARLKAMVYYEAFQIPVFSCDSGLYFDNVPDEVQPGVHVRNVNGKCLSDDEMMVEKSKPAPDIYIKAFEMLNENPEECIALEDSKNGLISAYRAGCKPIMVPDLWQPDEEILQIIKGKYSDLEQVKKAFESGEI